MISLMSPRFVKRLRVTGPCSLQLQVVMRNLQEVEVGAVLGEDSSPARSGSLSCRWCRWTPETLKWGRTGSRGRSAATVPGERGDFY